MKTYEDYNIKLEINLFNLVLSKQQKTIIHFILGLRYYNFYYQFVTDLNKTLKEMYKDKELLKRCKRVQVTRIENLIKYTDKIL